MFLCFQTADVKMLVKCLHICVHVFIIRPRFCVVCALNCARIFAVRELNCAQFLLHPALFPT